MEKNKTFSNFFYFLCPPFLSTLPTLYLSALYLLGFESPYDCYGLLRLLPTVTTVTDCYNKADNNTQDLRTTKKNRSL